MRSKQILLFLLINSAHHFCNAQVKLLDSCGLNDNPVLNQYEIKILDSLFFRPYKTKAGPIDSKHGFDLKYKKIAFYSCTRNSNTKGDGLISKKDFFALCKPNFNGHAGRGIAIFNDKEKKESKGFDAVILIDCPYSDFKNEELILKLVKKYD